MGFFVGTQSEIELRSQFGIGNWARELVQINDKAKLFDWLSQNGATRVKAFGVYDFWIKEGMGDARQFKWLFEYMLSRPLSEVKDKYWSYLNDRELDDIKYWAMAQRIKPITHKVAFIDCLYQLEMTATDIEELGEALQRREKCPQFDNAQQKWLKDYYDALKLVGDRGIGEYMDGAKKLGEAHGKAAFMECLSKLLPMINHDKDNTNDAKIIRLLADFSDTKQKWFEEYVEERKPKRQTTKQDEPDLINTPRAIKYFARAVEAGFMNQTEQGYEWLYGMPRGKVRLAYFLAKVYQIDPATQIPYKGLNMLFGVNRLDSAYSQIKQYTDDTPNVKFWKDQIHKLFNA